MITRDCIVGDRVKFCCRIKKGTFEGEVIEVINGDHLDEPTLLIHHLIPEGNNYHIIQSDIVELCGNLIWERIINELVHL